MWEVLSQKCERGIEGTADHIVDATRIGQFCLRCVRHGLQSWRGTWGLQASPRGPLCAVGLAFVHHSAAVYLDTGPLIARHTTESSE